MPTGKSGKALLAKREQLIPFTDAFKCKRILFAPGTLIMFRTQKDIKILNERTVYFSFVHFGIMIKIATGSPWTG